MSSTKKERIKKRHPSRNRRTLKKMVRNITNMAHTLRYPQIIAKVGDFYLPTQSGRNIIFKHGQETQCEMITRLPNKKEKYDEVMYALRFMYYFGNFSMKRNAYYTLKGMARKNPGNPCVINFIKKCFVCYGIIFDKRFWPLAELINCRINQKRQANQHR